MSGIVSCSNPGFKMLVWVFFYWKQQQLPDSSSIWRTKNLNARSWPSCSRGILIGGWNMFFCFRLLIQWCLPWQGHDSHLKSISTCAFCFDSRCLPRQGYSMDWYVRNHLVAGFANSNPRRLCNARFKLIDNEIFLIATKPIKKNEEIFVHYKIHRRNIAP